MITEGKNTVFFVLHRTSAKFLMLKWQDIHSTLSKYLNITIIIGRQKQKP